MPPLRILLIDNPGVSADFLPYDLFEGEVRVRVEKAESAQAVQQALQWLQPELVLCGLRMPGFQWVHAARLVQQWCPETPFVVLSESSNEQQDLDALRHGAADCVPRSDRARLWSAVRHAVVSACEQRIYRATAQELQESEMRFRQFMEQVPEAVTMKDLDGRFTFVNSLALQLLGHPPEQVLGHTLEQLFPRDVAERLGAIDRRALAVRQPIEAVEEVALRTGRRVFLCIRFPVLGKDGHPTMVGGVSVDITNVAPAPPPAR